jgi:hypothetical protein
MKVLAKNLSKQVTEINVGSDSTVKNFELKLLETLGLTYENVKLKVVFKGQILSNTPDETLSKLGIKDSGDQVIYIVSKNKKKVDHQQPSITSTPVTTPPVPTLVSLPVPSLVPPSVPTSVPVNLFDLAGSGVPSVNGVNGVNGVGGVGPGMNMNNFAQILSSPEALQQLFQNQELLAQVILANPQMRDMAQNNPEEFKTLLSNPQQVQQIVMQNLMMLGAMEGVGNLDGGLGGFGGIGGGLGGFGGIGGGPGLPAQIELTEDENTQINELISLGVTKNEAVYYYVSCGRDINAAANLILQDMVEGNVGNENEGDVAN